MRSTASGSFTSESIVQESLVIANHHHGFDLLDRLEHNAHDDDQAGSSKAYRSVEYASEDERKNTDDRKTDRADKDDVVQNPVEVITRRLAGTDTRDKASALLQIVGNLQRIERNGCIEVCEEDQHSNIYKQSKRIFDLAGIAPVG